MGDTPAESTKPTTMKCELIVRHTFFNKQGDKVTEVKDESETEEQSTETHALSLVRTFNEKKELERSTLTVSSKHILAVLRAVIVKHPSVAGDFSNTTEIESPYQPLVHYWGELHSHVEAHDDAHTRMHGRLLLRFMATEIGPEKAKFETQTKSGWVDWGYLWILYKPGDLVVFTEKSNSWLLRIVKNAYEESLTAGKYLVLTCAYTGHNGVYSGDALQKFNIMQKENFSQGGPCEIMKLPCVPRRFVKKGTEFEDMLYERGQSYLSLGIGSTVCDYEGVAQYFAEPPPGWFDLNSDEDPGVWKVYTEAGKVIIDPSTYGEEHVATQIELRSNLTRDDIILCPPYHFGYSCARKDWCRFFMSHVKEAKWREDPFKNLVLPAEQKMLVQALVSSHQYPEATRDQAQQKGKGLVCLLHGPPGSGKTLTAECAAQLTKRALFSCSMSELDRYRSPYFFEQHLATVLRLATAWKAIVLLDEADVFLEARSDDSSDDSARNALVAIFLKHLEYFSGIIFLTTNRVGVFDRAMKSRIHLALGYQEPGVAARKEIWRYQLTQLPAEGLDANMEELLAKVQDYDLNGREISYSVLTAATLARFSSEPLRFKHIETVLKVRRDFDDALRVKAKQARSIAEPSRMRQTASWPLRQNSVLSEEPDEINREP